MLITENGVCISYVAYILRQSYSLETRELNDNWSNKSTVVTKDNSLRHHVKTLNC